MPQMKVVSNVAYPDEPRGAGSLVWAIVAVLLVIAFTVVVGIAYTDTPSEPAEDAAPTYMLSIDCSNAALMHKYGLPTKADVMQWHVHGTWGYMAASTARTYSELPGGDEAWDAFYGIDSDNPAFER